MHVIAAVGIESEGLETSAGDIPLPIKGRSGLGVIDGR